MRSNGPATVPRVGVHRALDQVGGGERREPGGEPAGRRDAVGVGERQRLAGGDRGAGVARRARARPRARARSRTASGAALDHRGGVVGGAVVDHDHLELGARLLRGERGERGAEGRGGVARGDDDARGDHGADKLTGEILVRMTEMRDFWDARAAEDPYYFVDNRLTYGDPDTDEFWRDGERLVAEILELLELELAPERRAWSRSAAGSAA